MYWTVYIVFCTAFIILLPINILSRLFNHNSSTYGLRKWLLFIIIIILALTCETKPKTMTKWKAFICTYRLCPSWKMPWRSDQSMCMQNPINYFTVNHIRSDNSRIHWVRIFSPCSLCNCLPWMTVINQ